MKKIIYRLTPVIFGTLLLSCASKTEAIKEEPAQLTQTEKTAEKTETPEPKTVEGGGKDEIKSRYNYDKDWEIIKTQIVAKNKSEIKDWLRGENVSADEVIGIFSDPAVLKALKATSYKDLKTVTMNEEVFLIFYYEETAINEEGDEVGMSITMYMFQGEPNFQIDHIIAAG